MKVKSIPEDFIVNEEIKLNISKDKELKYKVYKLIKKDIDMFSIISTISRILKIDRKNIFYAGIKDRHGITTQYISFLDNNKETNNIKTDKFSLEFEGWTDEEITAFKIERNNFDIVLRDLDENELEKIKRNLESVNKYGIPNYYDEQRFGSYNKELGFLGKALFLGEKDKALKILFSPTKFDRSKDKERKKKIIENWNNWKKVLEFCKESEKKIFLPLVKDNRSYSAALSKIDKRDIIFYLNAYQSYLFNEILKLYLIDNSMKNNFQLYSYNLIYGDILFYKDYSIENVNLPVPGYDISEDDEYFNYVSEIFAKEGIDKKKLKVNYIGGVNVHATKRNSIVFLDNLKIYDKENDELNKNKYKLRISFSLPKGSYATILIKRISI